MAHKLTRSERAAANYEPLIPKATGSRDVAYMVKPASQLKYSVHKEWDPPMPDRLRARLSVGEVLIAEEVEKLATRMLIEPHGSIVPDIIGWYGGPFVVSNAVKQFIESVESNTHLFYPIQLVIKKSVKIIDGEYKLLFIPIILDSVIKHRSNIRRHISNRGGREVEGFTIDTFRGPVVLDKETISGHHLWRNVVPLTRNIFCSEEFFKRISNAGFKGWEFYPCHVMDR